MNGHEQQTAVPASASPRGRVLAPGWLPEPGPPAAIDPLLWPRDLEREHGGGVSVAGVGVTELVREYGTPLFVQSENDFRARARAFREAFSQAFPGIEVTTYYAGKSFLCTEIVRWVHSEGLHVDVCTGGEMAVTEHTSIPPACLSLHGNNKSAAELERALDRGVGRIVVDSLPELLTLEQLAAARSLRAPVMVRVTPGVSAHTHEYIATAHDDQKFGLALKAAEPLAPVPRTARSRAAAQPQCPSPAEEGVLRAAASAHLDLRGVHCHIGSQIFDTRGYALAAERLMEFCARMNARHNIDIDEVDLGGGFGIAYTPGQRPLEPIEIARSLAQALDASTQKHGYRPRRLSFEPGRAIVGPGGFTLYTVGVTKDVVVSTQEGSAVRRYISVDGGMSDNPRPVLYDADYTAVLASRSSQAEPVLSRVVGKHCESGDVVVRDVYLPADVAPGDLLAVPGTGAYCWSLASNYNYQPRPPVVAVREGRSRLIVKGETEADLLRRDPGVSV